MVERRSTRIAGQRASSVPADTKTPIDRKAATKTAKKPFVCGDVVDRITTLTGLSVLDKLTKDNLKEVVAALRDRYIERGKQLEGEQERAAHLNDDLKRVTQERDRSRHVEPAMRADQLRIQRLKAADAHRAASSADPATSMHDDSPPEPEPEPSPKEMDRPAEVSDTTNTDKQEATSTNTQSSTQLSIQSHTRSSLLGRLWNPLRNLLSEPSSSPAKSSTNPQPQQSLGELPANRKRPASEHEPEVTAPATKAPRTHTTSTPKAKLPRRANATPPPRTHTPHSNYAVPGSMLDTISEHTEESEASIRGTPAPNTLNRTSLNTPAPLDTPAPLNVETPRSRRSIQTVKQQQRLQANARDQTPARVWDTTPRPRRIDTRPGKFDFLLGRKRPIFEIQQDEEMEEFYMRPVKRVKVDEIAEIPHRRPGDRPGTFAVPEIDSDGELEVDEDVEMVGNLFEIPQAETQKDSGKQPARNVLAETSPPANNWTFPSVGEQPPAEQPTEVTVTDEWAFPSVGERPADESQSDMADFLGKKFAYGFEGWKRGLNLVEW
ncbi:hypothetical protein M409DRAFT_25943 [Zasmidium cellare ATCC 36951]|uniref:Uncharacterized protein n=1 Tax=Zasmidium cellare ATCC 36951 TaxID=1080233 RepID=A0A6A6CDM1_ZASCE|nr:uncharacterized protein M409DRAFT_25943 [Zasmidium cellare ATCC 36951]KAF2163759.1 hypothetical protein M409DRAFT_25943 [Zasmidium cellare ATCC 36951]